MDSRICRLGEGGSRGSHSKWSDTWQRNSRRSSADQKKGWIRTVAAEGLGVVNVSLVVRCGVVLFLPVTWVLSQHLSDEVVCLVCVIAESLQIIQIVQALDDVGFSHVSAVLIEGVAAACEDVVENTPQGEDVDCSCSSSVGLRVNDSGLGRISTKRGVCRRLWLSVCVIVNE